MRVYWVMDAAMVAATPMVVLELNNTLSQTKELTS